MNIPCGTCEDKVPSTRSSISCRSFIFSHVSMTRHLYGKAVSYLKPPSINDTNVIIVVDGFILQFLETRL